MSAGGTQLLIMEVSSYLTSGLLLLLLGYTLLRVWNGSRVDFLLILVSMLLISNLFFICYISVYNDRKNLE
jgi:membrane protein DedA with SNARE-associated domain